MSFRQSFERRVNEEMQEGQAGPAPRSPSIADTDIKKRPRSTKAASLYEAEDVDFSSKGEKTLPPRFSTLFDTSKLTQPTPQVVECCHREQKKRTGVTISTPLFVLLIAVLFFESTLLFAYTVIGLYQNLPSGLLGSLGRSAPVDGCHYDEKPGAINFAPNFLFGEKGADGQLSVMESITKLQPPTTAVTTPISSRSVPTTTSSADNAAAAASQVLGILADKSTSLPSVVHSTIVVTSTADSSKSSSFVRPTVTSVQFVDGPTTTLQV